MSVVLDVIWNKRMNGRGVRELVKGRKIKDSKMDAIKTGTIGVCECMSV